MKAFRYEIDQLIARDGVILRRERPHLIGALNNLVRAGTLMPVLPGVYAPPGRATDFPTRVTAAMRLWPDAVLTEHAAAKVSFWPTIRVAEVACALPTTVAPQRGFAFSATQCPGRPDRRARRHPVHRTGVDGAGPGRVRRGRCHRRRVAEAGHHAASAAGGAGSDEVAARQRRPVDHAAGLPRRAVVQRRAQVPSDAPGRRPHRLDSRTSR